MANVFWSRARSKRSCVPPLTPCAAPKYAGTTSLNQIAERLFKTTEHARFGHADGGRRDAHLRSDVGRSASFHHRHPEGAPGAFLKFAANQLRRRRRKPSNSSAGSSPPFPGRQNPHGLELNESVGAAASARVAAAAAEVLQDHVASDAAKPAAKTNRPAYRGGNSACGWRRPVRLLASHLRYQVPRTPPRVAQWLTRRRVKLNHDPPGFAFVGAKYGPTTSWTWLAAGPAQGAAYQSGCGSELP